MSYDTYNKSGQMSHYKKSQIDDIDDVSNSKRITTLLNNLKKHLQKIFEEKKRKNKLLKSSIHAIPQKEEAASSLVVGTNQNTNNTRSRGFLPISQDVEDNFNMNLNISMESEEVYENTMQAIDGRSLSLDNANPLHQFVSMEIDDLQTLPSSPTNSMNKLNTMNFISANNVADSANVKRLLLDMRLIGADNRFLQGELEKRDRMLSTLTEGLKEVEVVQINYHQENIRLEEELAKAKSDIETFMKENEGCFFCCHNYDILIIKF
jgi:hypothetical protein